MLNGHRLRICMLASCPFPANHGTPGSIREMAEAIVAEGHEVHVVTYQMGESIPLRGPVLHRIPPWTRESGVVVGPTVRRPLYDLQMVFKALQVIRQHRPHVIHAHNYEAALVGWLCRLATGLPVVYSGHTTMASELASYGFIRPQWAATALARLLDATLPRLMDRCLPHSSNLQRFFHRLGLRHHTESVVNFGIDVDWVQRGNGEGLRQRLGLGPGPVILYTGVLDRFQRLDLLLEAVGQLTLYEPAVKLLIVSTISQLGHAAAVRRRAAEMGLTRAVVLTDPQPLAAVRDYLRVGDIAVVPRPDAPGFPIKLLNYMAAEIPCVLFASSASRGLRHRDNVYLATPDTGAALGKGILELLRDVQLRRRLARNGHRFVRLHHDRRVVARQVCATYFRTLARAGFHNKNVRMPQLTGLWSELHPGHESAGPIWPMTRAHQLVGEKSSHV
jgi:glycosyltransferase involved in cell wall biosynthesis